MNVVGEQGGQKGEMGRSQNLNERLGKFNSLQRPSRALNDSTEKEKTIRKKKNKIRARIQCQAAQMCCMTWTPGKEKGH